MGDGRTYSAADSAGVVEAFHCGDTPCGNGAAFGIDGGASTAVGVVNRGLGSSTAVRSEVVSNDGIFVGFCLGRFLSEIDDKLEVGSSTSDERFGAKALRSASFLTSAVEAASSANYLVASSVLQLKHHQIRSSQRNFPLIQL